MDRGAARSRKQEKRGLENAIKPSESPRARARPPQDSQETQAGPSTSTTQTPREAPTSRFKPRIIDNTDPARFRPKAIRDSAALIWSQAEFPLPPPTESLEKVTRVDLTGSDCTDVSWLKGTKVTWLNLKGCKIESGWDAVGSLKDLTVLNISETGLQSLPAPLSELRNLKALVAMGNPWTELDSDVMENWDQLNSLIASHSPNLTRMPDALSGLRHTSKLSFSHCPRLAASGLPDLTDLPLLRDVKLNNLALLEQLPRHLATWGTGDLPASEHTSTTRSGDGLEVLDLGNCSLPFSVIKTVFLAQDWPQLRSVSLHSNPLAVTNPDYAEILRDSDRLPKLQIIDAKRVVERKRKGEVQESKIERRRREKKEKRRITGANARGDTENMRVWGGKIKDEVKPSDGDVKPPGKPKAKEGKAAVVSEDLESEPKKRKRSARETEPVTAARKEDSSVGVPAAAAADDKESESAGANKKRKRSKPNKGAETKDTPVVPKLTTKPSTEKGKATANTTATATTPVLPQIAPLAKATEAKRKPKRSEGGKVETVKSSAGGVNLNEVFTKPKAQDDAGGLGVGGW